MSQLDCPGCGLRYVDPSPAAVVEPRPCPQCGAKPPSAVETVVAAREAKIRELEAQVLALRGELETQQKQGLASTALGHELQEAAKALLVDLDNPDGDPLWLCDDCDAALAMKRNEGLFCDACGDEGQDLSYAPALRRLRALLGVAP